MKMGDNTGYLFNFAQWIGAPEQALRLLLSLLFVYPLLTLHRKYLKNLSLNSQHIFFVASGISLAIFNYGFHFIHSLACVLAAWLILIAIGGSLASVVLSFVFQMGYLLIGYHITATETYDIKWTMPHCVLTLRLIALTFDLYDGSKKAEMRSTDQQKTALEKCPSLLEIGAHCYFPAGFLVGPQFSMRRYQDWISDKLYPKDTPSSVMAGLFRGCTGLMYMLIYQIGSVMLPDSYILSDGYMELAFWKRLLIVGLWVKITLYKYISCWLVTEGACISSGIAYSGRDANNHAQWKGCGNVQITIYELGTSFENLIKAFNTNTNNWVMHYIYKRLRFLNNRYLSQLGALVFLAVWHGLHSGYYACFFMEFLVMYMEKNFKSLLNKYPKIGAFLNTAPVSYIVWILLKLYVVIFMGYCVGSFILLKSKRWWHFYTSLYFCGHIIFGGWLLYGPLLKILLRSIAGPPAVTEKPHAERKKD